ncbi:hypothetical protein [Sulfurisphaera javensis]|uniref:hypothetical protein n=1 Tax=Sulfurisphaera javensis TaxID=2049879 RepID=UPI0034E8CCA5
MSKEDVCLKYAQVLALASTIVVQLEQSYDIIDEMSRATDINKVLDGFNKLSRLVTKVYNDIADIASNENLQKDDKINKALHRLLEWNSNLSSFYENCSKNKDFLTYVKIFTSLSIAPDYISDYIKEILNR